VFFTRGSKSFRAACEQGVFEASNINILTHFVRPGTWMFDVGCNIGLMSIPVLRQFPDVSVLSFEPSANALPSLQQTVARNPFGDRWRLVPKAVGAAAGMTSFCLSSQQDSLFDGMKNTRRATLASEVQVEVTTLDFEWTKLGCPRVTMIKCDVEGAELSVLMGAASLVRDCTPAILLEWNSINLQAYECDPAELLKWAASVRYHIYALPHAMHVRTSRELELSMLYTESFLLLPEPAQ
jgi:FkbM family methyltransferase